MQPDDVPIVDIFNSKPLTRKARIAATETAAVLDGTVAYHPVTLLVHLKGDADPFPRKWQWGKFVLDGTRPAWRQLRLREPEDRILIPEDAVTTGPARPILRAELSAFCPNPRKTLIIPMISGTTNFYIGIPRQSVGTFIAALERGRRPPPEVAAPGFG
jgi:hypothetical protein